MNAKNWALTLAFGLLFGILTGCSSSPTSDENELSTDEAVPEEAMTDAVPADGSAEVAATDAPPPADSEPPMPADASPPVASTPDVDAAAPSIPEPPAPVASASDAGGGPTEDYSVQEGDTLMKIAFETYGDLYQWKKIYEGNRDKLSDPNRIPRGTVLKVEKPSSPVAIERNGDKYLIKTGDTLGKISDDIYGTKSKWKKLWENNKQLIKDPNRIFAGFSLYYMMSPEEREEADKLKQQKGSTPPPLAGGSAPPVDTAAVTPAPLAAPAPVDMNRDPAAAGFGGAPPAQ